MYHLYYELYQNFSFSSIVIIVVHIAKVVVYVILGVIRKNQKISFLTWEVFYMKQISMDFNKRQYMRPVDFELFYYNDTELRSVASHHHDYCEF